MDTTALKEERSRTGGDGNATLRRTATPKHNSSVVDAQKARRQNVDSGYSTSDGLDTRWAQDVPINGSSSNTADGGSKWSPTLQCVKSTVALAEKTSPVTSNYPQFQSPNGSSTPTISTIAGNGNSPVYNCDRPSDGSTPKRGVVSNGSTTNSAQNRFVLTVAISIGFSLTSLYNLVC